MKNIFRSFRGYLSTINDWVWMNLSESKKTRFRAVIELLVTIPVFIYCIHLYGKWNEVPVHTDEIEVACLKYHQPATDTVSEWSPIARITYEINTSKVRNATLRAGDILLDLTDHWKPYKNYNPSHDSLSWDKYVQDSIALHSDYWTLAKLKRRIVSSKTNGVQCEDEQARLLEIFSRSPNKYNKETQLDSSVEYQTMLLDSLKTYVKDSISWWLNNPTKDLYALYYFKINCKWNISEHEDYNSGPYLGLPKQDNSGARKITFCGYKDSTYYQYYYILKTEEQKTEFSDSAIIAKVESPLVNPKWFSKFDISQSYFDIKLRCEAVDSVILKFDFVGATDFSQMIPKPDSIDMSSITFSNPVKIAQIKEKGLSFHAHFKEKDGLQTIRLFAVTALMCVFTPILLMCLINIISLFVAAITSISHHKKNKKRRTVLE